MLFDEYIIRVIYVKVYAVVIICFQRMFFHIVYFISYTCMFILCLFERSALLRSLFRIRVNWRSTESNQGLSFGLIMIVFSGIHSLINFEYSVVNFYRVTGFQ